jgi:hypothetical protein
VLPHEDCWQGLNHAHTWRIRRNVCISLTGTRGFNGGQIKTAGGAPQYDCIIEDNELRSPRGTAFTIDSFIRNGTGIEGSNIDVIIRNNKCSTGGRPLQDSDVPTFGSQSTPPTNSWNDARMIVTGNVAPKLALGGAPNNTAIDDETTFPPNWVVKARDKVAPGQPFSGHYGRTAGVIP